jgi:hypothetical protein
MGGIVSPFNLNNYDNKYSYPIESRHTNDEEDMNPGKLCFFCAQDIKKAVGLAKDDMEKHIGGAINKLEYLSKYI